MTLGETSTGGGLLADLRPAGIARSVVRAATYSAKLRYGIRQIRRRGVWFVDVPRTSSSSVRAELGRLYGVAYAKSRIVDAECAKEGIFPCHLPALTMRRILGSDVWRDIFTFAFVRNPWDRLVSLYAWRKRQGTLPGDVSFREYVLMFNGPRYTRRDSPFTHHAHYFGACEYVLDESDNVIVDFVGRYENRAEDMRRVSDKLGIRELGHTHLLRTNVPGMHYSEYYDDETRDIVGRVFRKDVDLFCYEFDDHRSPSGRS
jgi:hypothetical protein